MAYYIYTWFPDPKTKKVISKENAKHVPKEKKSKTVKTGTKGKSQQTKSSPKKSTVPKKSPSKSREKSLLKSGRRNKKNKVDESETEFSEADITIHDSESDDIEGSMSGLRI